MTEILSLGEVLIDLTQVRTDERGIPQFSAFPGGAPANVAVAAARLGGHSGFAGKIGRDGFGAFLRQTLEGEGVGTEYLYEADAQPTTLAIVSVDASGERSFAFYRNPGADTQLTEEEALAVFAGEQKPRILHFGSLSFTHEPARSAALAAVRRARAEGILVSYDPNYRPALWAEEGEAIRWMKEPLPMVDILKVSDEEMEMLTGTADLDQGARLLADQGIGLVLVTLGSEGVYYRMHGACGKLPGQQVQVSDTNGAGDTFLGAVLTQLAELLRDLPADGAGADPAIAGARGATAAGDGDPAAGVLWQTLTQEALEAILDYANRAAAITCSRPGAIPAMPTRQELAGTPEEPPLFVDFTPSIF